MQQMATYFDFQKIAGAHFITIFGVRKIQFQKSACFDELEFAKLCKNRLETQKTSIRTH